MKKNFVLVWVMVIALSPGVLAAKKQRGSGEDRARPAGKTLLQEKPQTTPTSVTSPVSAPIVSESKRTAASPEESMDVTITGEARDEIPVVLDPPPLELPFSDIAGLSRDGQTDRVLNGPLEHIGGGELLSIALLPPRQILGALPTSLPTPPFIQMELAPGLNAARWDFRVLDEDNRMIHRQDGAQLPKDLIVWDGTDAVGMKIRVGRVYTPLLILTSINGKIERYYGEPVLFDALQYTEGNQRRTEFLNETFFGKGSTDMYPEMAPLLKSLLAQLRENAGAVCRLTVHHNPEESALARARLKTWSTLLEEALMRDPSAFVFNVAPATERGDISEVVFEVQP
jgi:hypothetical protein